MSSRCRGEDPPMAPPGQLTMEPRKVLSRIGECAVTEKTSILEVLSAAAGQGDELEMPNKYKVMVGDRQVFFIHETTDACTRQMKQCCCDDCGGWNVDMR